MLPLSRKKSVEIRLPDFLVQFILLYTSNHSDKVTELRRLFFLTQRYFLLQEEKKCISYWRTRIGWALAVKYSGGRVDASSGGIWEHSLNYLLLKVAGTTGAEKDSRFDEEFQRCIECIFSYRSNKLICLLRLDNVSKDMIAQHELNWMIRSCCWGCYCQKFSMKIQLLYWYLLGKNV